MGDFNNVSMGNGTLSIDSTDVGFLKGDVNFKYNYEVEEFKTGVPRSLRGSITKEITAELSAPFAEITAANIGNALGGLTPTPVAALEVDLTGSWTTLTAVLTHSLYVLKLGPVATPNQEVTISDGEDAPVITDLSAVTTYTEDDDYTVDYDTGYVTFLPTGTHYATFTGDAQMAKAKFKYTPPASNQIALGYSFALNDVEVEFIHTNPTTGKDITVHFWKANSSGTAELNFAEESWIVNNVTFKAVYDSTHTSNPLGYIDFEE